MALGYRIFKQFDRPSPELVARFVEITSPDPANAMKKAGTPDLADAAKNAGLVDPGIRPIYSPMPCFAGPAVTVSLPTSTYAVTKIAMEMTRPGDVLVVAARGKLDFALLGGNMCKGLKYRGLAGVIVDGAVRDAAQTQAEGLPVHARGLAAGFNLGQVGQGEVNVPVAFGGCVIYPGDIIVADEEGIVAVPPAHGKEILERVAALIDGHARIQPVLERGDIVGIDQFRQELESTGFEFIDAAWNRP